MSHNLHPRIIPLWDSGDSHIRKLSFNYDKFRGEFVRLKSMSEYERANDKAEKSKARKYREYEPLPKWKFFDDANMEYVTALAPVAKSAYRPDRVSTKGGILFSQRFIVKRFTEILAVLRARGYPVLDCDLYFKSQRPITLVVRYCSVCHQKKAISMFQRNKNVYDGVGYACSNCRQDRDRRVWRRDAAA